MLSKVLAIVGLLAVLVAVLVALYRLLLIVWFLLSPNTGVEGFPQINVF